MTTDYRSTVFLPQTGFPMRAGLPKREPEIMAEWAKMDLWKQLRETSRGREKFILHDGPPYANGHLHIGHALNKILKDVINRSQQMLGKDANYVPGWDCHGLPIEWKIEEQYRAKGKDKDQVPVVDFRRECREFADHWIDVQREEFKRLGVEGDWEHPYLTMAFEAEALIAAELLKFAADGQLYRGSKPVLWSVVEKTALAEAETEYHDHVSKTIWVRFPVTHAAASAVEGASVVIWTTTPWTMPGNRAIAYGEKVDYSVIEVTATEGEVWATAGEKLVIARDLVAAVCEAAKIKDYKEIASLKGKDLAGTLCAHPLNGQGYDFDVPLLPGDFVSAEEGTGFVHIAPGHGADDWALGMAHGIEVPMTVGEDGTFYDHVPLFAGKAVYTQKGKEGDANEAIIKAMVEAGGMLARGRLTHSYPHSWRSKAPLIFRNTPQWFISMEEKDLRKKALKAIDDTAFYPKAGQARLRGMIAERPDWVISRQRAWGVPITVFVNKETGELLRDETVNARIIEAFKKEGADAWFAQDAAQRFLGNDYNAEEWDKVDDILDVWFDSGSTHAFCLEQREDLAWPASLYLEGSDQHRGWFHSSLLESCGTRGRAPYDAVLTHGFVMDEKGYKMAKSMGNTVAPQEVIEQYGADILRLWVVASDYSEDLRIGPEILKQQADTYRRLRNTLRYLLGSLSGFHEAEKVDPKDMPELERWVLHRLVELDADLRKANAEYDFHPFYTKLHNFCAVELSAFYFDIRKDSLYCDRLDDPRRLAARTVMDILFNCLTAWLAPVLCFTAEEAWMTRREEGGGGEETSVHLRTFPDIPAGWRDDGLGAKWHTVRQVRRVVTGALELKRAEKQIGSSLEAWPDVYVTKEQAKVLAGINLPEIFLVSGAEVIEGAAPEDAFAMPEVPGTGVVFKRSSGEKCERCWRVLPDIGADPAHPTVCGRCAEAVQHLQAAAD